MTDNTPNASHSPSVIALQHDMLTLKRKLTDVHLENQVLRYQLHQMNALLSIAMSKLGSMGVSLDTPIDVRALQAGVQRCSAMEAAQTDSAGGVDWGLHDSDRSERARPPSKRFQMRSLLREHNKAVQSCAFSPGEEPLIVSCGLDGRIVLHNFFTAATQWEVRGHEENVVDVAWFDATQNILSGSYDNTVKLWDPRGGETKALYQHSTHAFVLSLTPLDRSAVFACSDASRRTSIVDVRAHKPITWEHESRVNAMTYDSNTTQLILGHGNGEISVWDIRHAGAALFATSSAAASYINPNNNGGANANSKSVDSISGRSSSVSSMGAERAAITTAAMVTSEAVMGAGGSTASVLPVLPSLDGSLPVQTAGKERVEGEERGVRKGAPAAPTMQNTPDTGSPGLFSAASTLLPSLPHWQGQAPAGSPYGPGDGEAKRTSPVQCVSRILNDTSHASISFLAQLNLHDESKRLLCTSADNMVRLYNYVLDAQRTESRGGDMYQLRNLCTNVPSRGFRVRAGFWKGNRDKPQASVFFDDGEKDNEQPVTRRLTECDLVITGGVDNTATVFDVTEPGNAVVLDYLAGHRDRITGATVHPSQSRLIVATTSVDASIRIWVPAKS